MHFDRCFNLLTLLVAELRTIELAGKQVHAALLIHHRAAFGLGRVRGEDRDVLQMTQQFLQLFRTHPFLAKATQRVVKRAVPEIQATANHAAAFLVHQFFFGNIDQTEVQAERPHHLGELVGR